MTLRVAKIGPGATVQDGGRRGRMHEGVPQGGALVPELLARTNRAIGNDPRAPAIELPLHGAQFVALEAMTISIDGETRPISAGEAIDVPSSRDAVRYVALAGGVDVPEVLGGRGALLVAELGRLLRAADELRAVRREVVLGPESPLTVTGRIRVVRGPDAIDDASWERFVSTTWRVSKDWSRTGLRLDGPALPIRVADRRVAIPLVFGAIQLVASGQPVILGPDHPTTGGYPVIAGVVSADRGAAFAIRPGGELRFG